MISLRGGMRKGFKAGWNDGYFLGRCDAIRQQCPEIIIPPWDIKVIYVMSGEKLPFSAIDLAIIQHLQMLTRELHVVLPTENVAALAQLVQPNLVLVLSGTNFPVAQTDMIRSFGIPAAIWFIDDPYYSDLTGGIALHYDIVFTLELQCVSFYKGLGCPRVYQMPLAVHPGEFHPKKSHSAHRTEICFIGSGYWYRIAFFDRIAKFLATKNVIISGLWWDRLAHYRLLRKKIMRDKWMLPEKTATYYNSAQIVINLHRSFDDEQFNRNSQKITALSVNPRTFEIAGCGAFELCDTRADLASCYTPGVEIATYASPEELIDKVNYYLHHHEERREIALRGYRKTLQQHTYYKRISQLLHIVFEGGS